MRIGRGLLTISLALASPRNSSRPVGKLPFAPQRTLSTTNVPMSSDNLESPTKKQKGLDGEPVGPALKVKKLSPDATLPARGSARAAGYDLFAAAPCEVPAQGKALVKTDISIAIPPGYYGRVAPRSGLAVKNFIDVGAGVIDEDYRGPVGVVLFNFSTTPFEIKKGDRIAQLLLEKIITPPVIEVDDLDATERGHGGFGSTGK